MSLDKGCRKWLVDRWAHWTEQYRHMEEQRMRKIRDMIATHDWKDLAPCRGCNLPCVKAEGVSCDWCGDFVSCGVECDPWASRKCTGCGRIACVAKCAKWFWGCKDGYCVNCAPAMSASASSDLSYEAE